MISRIPLTLSNAYLINCERPILVDTGSSGDLHSLRKHIEKEGRTIEELALVVHTHAHASHVGSMGAIKALVDIPSIIHKQDCEWLRTGISAPVRPAKFSSLLVKPFVPRKFTPVTPELIFEDELDLSPFGINAHLLHTPGHTDGSASVIFDNGDAIVGDLLQGGYFAGLMLPSKPRLPYFVRDKETLLLNIQRLLDRGVERFFPGRGGIIPRNKVEALVRKNL